MNPLEPKECGLSNSLSSTGDVLLQENQTFALAKKDESLAILAVGSCANDITATVWNLAGYCIACTFIIHLMWIFEENTHIKNNLHEHSEHIYKFNNKWHMHLLCNNNILWWKIKLLNNNKLTAVFSCQFEQVHTNRFVCLTCK